MATVEFPGFNHLNLASSALADPDASPLMEEWRRVIFEGNRRGVLAGVDGNDVPMPPLKYRNGRGRKTADRKRAYGAHAASQYSNLSAAQYRALTGPRLAPQGAKSRVVTNLDTAYGRDPAARGRWFAVGAWDSVVSKAGVPFLPFHFEGTRTLPKYDLRPVRPADREKARRAMVDWAAAAVRAEIRKAFGGR